MVSPQALLIALAAALLYFGGMEAVQGAKWVGHEGKKVATKIVHVVKKVHF